MDSDPDSDPDPDADPDPSIFITDLQDAKKKLIFLESFPVYYFFKVLVHHFQSLKGKKMSQNSRNQGYLTIFA
jgi:hypothetical protein